MENDRTTAAIAGLTALYAALSWFGNASAAAAVIHDYPFNDPIGFQALFADMTSLSIGQIVESSDVDTMMPFSNLILLGSFVLATAGLALRNWTVLLLAVAITVPYGILGLLSITGPFDGEWLGEGWAMLGTIAVWMTCLGGVTFTLAINRATHTQTKLLLADGEDLSR